MYSISNELLELISYTSVSDESKRKAGILIKDHIESWTQYFATICFVTHLSH